MRWEAFIDTYDPAHFNEHVHYAGDEPTPDMVRSGNLRDALATAARSHGEVQGGERKLLATGLRPFIDQAKKSINKQLRDKSNKTKVA